MCQGAFDQMPLQYVICLYLKLSVQRPVMGIISSLNISEIEIHSIMSNVDILRSNEYSNPVTNDMH